MINGQESGVVEKKSGEEMNTNILWILGLMHSGTTIVWRAFRRDNKFTCFDEPFSGLGVLPGQNSRNSLGELKGVFEKDPALFWDRYAPLHPLEELDAEFKPEQKRYLRYLLLFGDRFVIDETHLHTHIEDMAKFPYQQKVIHLVRRARGFATSHLRSSWSKRTSLLRRAVRYLRNEYNKRVFWTRDDLPPGLRRDDAIGRSRYSKFGLMLEKAGYDAERIMGSTAIVRLLAYWHYHYHYLEKEGPKHFGQNFKTVWYEDFASDPERVMASLYEWMGMERPEGVRYDEVHPPKPPYKEHDRRWLEAARIAGFSEEELETLL